MTQPIHTGRLDRFIIIALSILGLMAGLDARAACSPYLGKVVINEVDDAGFVEIKILDPSVITATSKFAGWKLAVFRNKSGGGYESTTVGFDSVFSNIGKNACGQNSAWIKIPSGDLNNYLSGRPPFNFVLYDDSGSTKDIVDLLRITTPATTMYSGLAACPTIEGALPSSQYDAAIGSGSSIKTWFRNPDGTGSWSGTETGTNKETTCSSNNGGGAFSLTKIPSATSVALGASVTYNIYAQNGATGSAISNFAIIDNVPAGLTYSSCTAPTGGSCGTIFGTPYIKACSPLLCSDTLTANESLTGSFTFTTTATGTITNTASALSLLSTVLTDTATITVTGSVTPSSFAAYETSVSDANAPTATNQTIKTRVASASGNLCAADGTTCGLTVAAFLSGAVASAYSGSVTAALEYCSNVSRSGSSVTCGGSWSAISGASQTVTLTSGKGTATFGAIANAYEMVRVKISSATVSGTPWVPSAPTSYFAIRPSRFGTIAVRDADWVTAGTSRSLTSGANTHKAGQFFRIDATADNGSATTTNYPGTGTGPVVTTTTSTTPATCNGTCTLVPGTWSSASGVMTSSTAHYDEVGIFNATLQDQNYADIDIGDSSTTERYFSGTATGVGRFVPDHFTLTGTLSSTVTGCSGFAYFGQTSIGAVVTLEAREKNEARTTNYTGGSFAISNDNGGVAVTEVLSPTLPAASWTLGRYQITGANGPYALARPAAASLPAGPYDSFRLKFTVTDADSVTFTSGSNIAYTSTLKLRLGRLALFDKTGTSTAALAMNVEGQYWDSTTGLWLKNTDDGCTSVPSSAVVLSGYAPSGWTTSVTGPISLTAGGGTLNLSAPSPARPGRVNVAINLGASGNVNACSVTSGGTAMNAAYLRSRYGSCGAGTYDKDPSATANFGYYNRVPFKREVFN